MVFKVEFTTSNAAFDEEGGRDEIGRILKEISNKVKAGANSGIIMDINGNRIGWWTIRR